MRISWISVIVVTVLGLAGCGLSTSRSSTDPSSTRAATLDGASTRTAVATAPVVEAPVAKGPAAKAPVAKPLPTKILVVIEENHSLAQMKSGMPYLSALSHKYGYATHWSALTHPSEANYLAIAGGSTFGVTDDATPAVNAAKVGSAASVFSQARKARKSAATYAESMPHPCYLKNSGSYAVRHNPWTYFGADRTACRAHNLSTAGFVRTAKANKLPNVAFLIPNLVHDAHDGSLGDADAWLKGQLAPVLASKDFTSGKLIVVVTADEDDRHSGNQVLTSVLSPRISHKVVSTRLNHYSLTRFIAQVLRVKPLRNGASAPNLRAAFGL